MVETLTSWTDAPAKSAIVDFVRSVTSRGETYVPTEERIATFDNDGTLWCEKPTYPQADFVFRRWAEQAKSDPEKALEYPWKAIVENDKAWLTNLAEHRDDLVKGLTEAWSDMTPLEFEQQSRHFYETVTHPTLGVPYTQLGYRPMIELLRYLESHDFTIYIVTGGGRDFVRVISEQMYGIPREHVIGSGSTLEYRAGQLYRTAGAEQPIDDGPGKPIHIWTRTGRTPLFAGGNSDGDVPMLETARFGLLVRHDDGDREFQYDTRSEHALAEAKERNWTVVSMKRDFATIF